MAEERQDPLVGKVEAGKSVAAGKIGKVIMGSEAEPRYVPRMAPPRPTIFVGRDDELTSLVASLRLNEGAVDVPPIALKGMGGVGKTTLATALAHHPEVEAGLPDGVLWCTLGPEPDVMTRLADWGALLGEDLSKFDSAEMRSRRLSTLLYDKRALVVVDDAWEAEPARDFLIGGRGCRQVVTTRDTGLARQLCGDGKGEVPCLAEDPSLELLRAIAPDAVRADEEGARALIRQLGGLPLALTLAGHMLAQEWEAGLGAAGALKELEEREGRLKLEGAEQRPGLAEAKPSLRAILGISYDRLPDEASKRGFRFLGAFGANPLSFSPEAAAAVLGLELRATKKLLALHVRRGLVETAGTGRHTLHTTLADYAESLLEKHGETDSARQTHAAYYLDFAKANARENWRAVEVELNQIRRGYELARSREDSRLLVEYSNAMLRFMDVHGLWDDGLEWAQSSRAILEQRGDQDDLAKILGHIGNLLENKGEWDGALHYYNRSREIREQTGDQTGLGITLNNIGFIHSNKGEWDDALHFYRQSKEIREQLSDQAGVANTLNNIGGIYDKKGQWDEALRYYNRSREIREQLGDQAGLANTLNNIGFIYSRKGNGDEALRYYNRSREIREQIGDQAGLAVILNNIGGIYDKKGEWDEALHYYNNSREISEQIGDQAGLAVTLNNIGVMYRRKGEWDEALHYYNHSREIKERIGDQAGLATTLFNVGQLLEEQGKIPEAVEVLERVVEIDERIGHPDLDRDRAELERVKKRLESGE